MPYTIKWTEEMVGYLYSHQDRDNEEICRHLGISTTTLSKKFRELGIRRPKNRHSYQWTPEKDAYLREHWPDDAACDIAEALGTCYGTVKRRADFLGLKKSSDFNTYKFHNRWCKDYKHSIRKVA